MRHGRGRWLARRVGMVLGSLAVAGVLNVAAHHHSVPAPGHVPRSVQVTRVVADDGDSGGTGCDIDESPYCIPGWKTQ